jgi:hypothetical protein
VENVVAVGAPKDRPLLPGRDPLWRADRGHGPPITVVPLTDVCVNVVS